MKKIFLNLIQRIRKFISWLWNQEGSPFQRALGLGVGIFSGCFPFFGLQTLMGVFLAKIFKGNSILAAVGTWISNPLEISIHGQVLRHYASGSSSALSEPWRRTPISLHVSPTETLLSSMDSDLDQS
jgi:uncharacterized protein (DUF2062 family)